MPGKINKDSSASKSQPKKPLISIICPIFNVEKYIAETVESVLSQDYKNWELLIMDGASTDRTLATGVQDGFLGRMILNTSKECLNGYDYDSYIIPGAKDAAL